MSSSNAPPTQQSSSSSASGSRGKSLAESLLPGMQDNLMSTTPALAAQVSNWLELYHGQVLPQCSTTKMTKDKDFVDKLLINNINNNNNNNNTSGKKNMIQLYAEFMASYQYGLQYISTLQDFTQTNHVPDNFMEGNFPSTIMDNEKTVSPSYSSSVPPSYP